MRDNLETSIQSLSPVVSLHAQPEELLSFHFSPQLTFPSWPGLPFRKRFEDVSTATKKAIAIQENFRAAYRLLAVSEFNSWQWAQAGKDFSRAIELAPSDVWVRASYARFLAALGHFDEAIAQIERARKLAKNSPLVDVAAGEIYWQAMTCGPKPAPRSSRRRRGSRTCTQGYRSERRTGPSS
jgi:tetratricopeptide (TPR) repeat protein